MKWSNQQVIEDSLGKYLREHREAAELTQSQVAKTLGFSSPQFISNIERGLCSPPLYVLKKLITIYDLDVRHVTKFLLQLQEQHFLRELSGKRRRKRG